MIPAPDLERPTVRWDRLACYAIAVLAAIAPAFSQDDASYFNYLNNAINPPVLFYTRDYVPVVPELVASSLRWLPFVWQAALYRVLPLLVMCLLFRELRALLRRDDSSEQSTALAFAMVAIVWPIEQYVWANLSMVVTPACIVAAVHVIRRTREGRPFSGWAMSGIILAAVSVPFGILLVPILFLSALMTGDRRRRSQAVGLGVSIAVIFGWLNRPIAGALLIDDPRTIAASFVHAMRTDFRLNNVLALMSIAVLAAEAVRAYRRARPELLMSLSLLIWGAGSLAGVLLSNRLSRTGGGIAGPYLLPALIAAMLVVCLTILRHADPVARAMRVGVFVGVAGTALGSVMFSQLRGPLEVALMKYRFLMVAQEFRADCRDGDGMVFEFEDTSPVVLCRRQPFSIGRHLQDQFPPAVGGASPDAAPGERPAVIVGEPVF